MSSVISIRKVQMGLHQAIRQGMTVPSPGTIDGAWGPTTERSLDTYLLGIVPPFHGEVAIIPETGQIDFEDASIAAGLDALARGYQSTASATATRAPVRTSPTAMQQYWVDQPSTLDLNPSPTKWWMWAGAALTLAGIGGAVWWFSRKRRF